jgi:hypothetical protein
MGPLATTDMVPSGMGSERRNAIIANPPSAFAPKPREQLLASDSAQESQVG